MSPLAIAVLTISDSRTPANDTSGDLLVERLTGNGHLLASRDQVPDNVYQIRATVSNWIADDTTDVVLATGGTGFTGRDLSLIHI